jgi:7-cyano-7-deazaguanine synthase
MTVTEMDFFRHLKHEGDYNLNMAKRSSVCVLVSGGLDSDVLLAEAAKKYRRVWPVYVAQGLRWEKEELYWLKRYLSAIRSKGIAPLQILSVPMADLYGSHWSTGKKPVPGARTPDQSVYLPGRNMALSVKAAVFAAMRKIPVLALGSLDHNPFPDASPRFFKAWGKALGAGLGTRLKVLAPYRTLSKVDVIRRGARLPLHLSFSCISPKGKRHCGRCNKCAERRRAFKTAKVKDRTVYAKG